MRKNTAKFGPSRTEGNVEMGGGGSAQGANIFFFCPEPSSGLERIFY